MGNDRRTELRRVASEIESGATQARRAAAIRAWRGDQQLSKAELSRRTGINSKRVTAILDGDKVYLHELEAICSLMGTPVSAFLARTEAAA